MATRKSAKKSGTKKLTKAKKMNKVKPLISFNYAKIEY